MNGDACVADRKCADWGCDVERHNWLYKYDVARAMISVTTGATPERYSASGVYGEIDRALWQPQKLTLEYMGYDVALPFVAYATPRIDDAQRQRYLDECAVRVRDLTAQPIVRDTSGSHAPPQENAAAWTRKT